MVMQEMTNKAGKHNTSGDEICSDKDIMSCFIFKCLFLSF